jgi:hypothetical protein
LILTELQAASLILCPQAAPEEADLTGAAVGRLADEPANWPSQLRLRGFTYAALDEKEKVSAGERLGWLTRDRDGYSPQPYEQLAAVYRREGREQDAREVAIARQRARRRTLALPGRLWSLLLDVAIGYGYRTWLAGVWLLGWWAAGTLVFAAAYPHHLIPAAPNAPHPAFQPVIYALDVLLPVVDLNQQEFWIPAGPGALVRVGIDPGRLAAGHGNRGRRHRGCQAGLTNQPGSRPPMEITSTGSGMPGRD